MTNRPLRHRHVPRNYFGGTCTRHPHPEERPLGRVSKDAGPAGASWFETREDALLTMRRDTYLTAGGTAIADGSARGPRIRASNSAVGQESAGRPYLTCIAFTAVRLCWPSTPSTLPTLNPARTRSCCSSLISLKASWATGAAGWRIGGLPAMRVAR